MTNLGEVLARAYNRGEITEQEVAALYGAVMFIEEYPEVQYEYFKHYGIWGLNGIHSLTEVH